MNNQDEEDLQEQSKPINNKMTSSLTVVVDKDASPDLGSKSNTIEKHQISELTDSIVDDLIKNAFRPEPVQIEKDKKEGGSDDEDSSTSLE